MKKILLLALLGGGLSLCTTGCKMSSATKAADSLVADSADSVTEEVADVPALAVDSIGFHAMKDSALESTFIVDYPQGSDDLAMAVKRFVVEQLQANYLPRSFSDDKSHLRKYPDYSGSIDNGKTVLRFFGKGTMRYLQETLADMAQYMDNTSELPSMYQKVKVKKEEDNGRYLTYSVSDENYLGGAHGSYSFYYVNIDKHTCKPVTTTVDTLRVKALQPLLRKGVLRYLKECGETSVTLSNLKEYLILPDDGLIPLPVNAPWVQNDSLNFVYQQYEIASYATGLIQFNIAVKDMEPYLTKEAKAMLGK